METKPSYTMEGMQELIRQLSKFFDVVRLVDPIAMIVYDIADGEFKSQEYNCFHVWKKNTRCENCVSARSHMMNGRSTKFEFIGDISYHVVAQAVAVDGRDFVLEVVTRSDDNVMISSFGRSEFAEIVRQFNHKLYTDVLTGIYNRRYIDERYPILVNFLYSGNCSLSTVMMDVDGFKQINDAHGHSKGDEVLRFIADTLKKHFPERKDAISDKYSSDIVARYGGDEFLVAVSGMDKTEIKERIEAFQREIADNEDKLTVSAGVYYQEYVRSLDCSRMIELADEALYRTKHQCKGGVSIIE